MAQLNLYEKQHVADVFASHAICRAAIRISLQIMKAKNVVYIARPLDESNDKIVFEITGLRVFCACSDRIVLFPM